ncbi:hypothetical protein RYX56_23580, partial [Alkalihalophilus lindianensis]
GNVCMRKNVKVAITKKVTTIYPNLLKIYFAKFSTPLTLKDSALLIDTSSVAIINFRIVGYINLNIQTTFS